MDSEPVPTDSPAPTILVRAPWRIERVVTADLSGAGMGACHGASDAGALGAHDEPSAHEYGPAWRYRELARASDATISIAFADAETWEGAGRAAIAAAIKAGKPATHCELPDRWAPEDISDQIVVAIADWCRGNEVKTLHVVGPSETEEPGIGAMARALVGLVIERAACATFGDLLAEVSAAGDAADLDVVEERAKQALRESVAPTRVGGYNGVIDIDPTSEVADLLRQMQACETETK